MLSQQYLAILYVDDVSIAFRHLITKPTFRRHLLYGDVCVPTEAACLEKAIWLGPELADGQTRSRREGRRHTAAVRWSYIEQFSSGRIVALSATWTQVGMSDHKRQ
jgi:hypothetical protein